MDVVGAQRAQGGGTRPSDTQPADDRCLSHEELDFVGGRPALGDVELQELVQPVNGETDPGAVEDRLARPVENAHELRAVDAGNDGPELVGVGGNIEAADFHKQHSFGLLSNENWMNGSATTNPAPPHVPVGGSRRIGRTNRSCQTISHSQVVMGPITGPPSRIAYCAGDGEGTAGRRRAGRGASAERRRRGGPAASMEAVPGTGRTTEGSGSA